MVAEATIILAASKNGAGVLGASFGGKRDVHQIFASFTASVINSHVCETPRKTTDFGTRGGDR